MTSSIKSGAVLRNPVTWTATVKPAAGTTVAGVDFLIDGHVRWSEQQAPYQFNEGGLFAPWPLGNGRHKFAVRALAPDGRTVSSSSAIATVKAPSLSGPPAGTYRRTVTVADQTRVRPYRDAEHGASGNATPTGAWSLQIRPSGVLVLDQVPHPQGFDPFSEPFAGSNHRLTVYGPAFWLQAHPDSPSNFCEPERPSAYQWSLSGTTLTIKAVQHECADRDTALVGTWKHA